MESAVKKDSSPGNNQSKTSFSAYIALFIVMVVILLGAVGYFAYDSHQKTIRIDQALAEIQEKDKLRAELETAYNGALADLESQKTTNLELNTANSELNATIDQQKAELTKERNRISALLAGNNGDRHYYFLKIMGTGTIIS